MGYVQTTISVVNPIIYERTFTANYYLDEYDMGDGEIWYDEWYDFCGELKVFMMLPRSRPYTFCDIELAKLFYPLYSPTNIVPDIETGYPAIFDCTYHPPSPSASAMAAVDYYWMPTYQWQLVPACKLEVYYDEANVFVSYEAAHSTLRLPKTSDMSISHYYYAYWTDPAVSWNDMRMSSDESFAWFQENTINTLIVQRHFEYRGPYNDVITSVTPLCAEINTNKMSWIGRLNAFITATLYGESVEYREDETADVAWLGWNPNPWGQGRTNCHSFGGGYEALSDGPNSFTRVRCRLKVTKPEELTALASGVVLRIKVIETYNDTLINNDYKDKYLINTSREPVVISDEEVTVAFGDVLEYEATRNTKDIVWNEFPDCPAEDAIAQYTFVRPDLPYNGVTCSQRVEVRLISYIC